MRALIKIAERYEAEREAAIERSDIRVALLDLHEAAWKLRILAGKIRKIEPLTMMGVVVQARALAAHSEAEIDADGIPGHSGIVLGRELAAAVLRLAGQGGVA